MRQLFKRVRWRVANGRRADDGFSLTELLISMVVIGIILAGMAGVQVKALATVALSRQRQQAIDLANRTMEQIRALPYDTVTAGLRTSDLSGDANITSGMFEPAYDSSISEHIVSSASASSAPLYPHVQAGAATTVGPVQFRVASYVSLVSATAGDTLEGYWLTAIVTWSSAQTNGVTKTVATRSQLFSPSGCLSTATHPFSGPCQAYFDATAGDTPAGISIATSSPGLPALIGDDLQTSTVSTPSLSAVLMSEQTISTQGKAVTSGAKYSTGTVETAAGEVGAASGATTDPATGEAAFTPTATSFQGTSTVSSSTGAFALGAGSGDSATAASTTEAAGTCLDLSDVAVNTGEPCSNAKVTPSGNLTATLAYNSKTLPLASITAAGTPSRAFVARYLSSGGAICPTASGIGCISAKTAGALGAATMGGTVPSATGHPAGFSQMVSLSGFTTTAGAESGIGAAGPTTTRAGTLTYWSGAANVNVNLATALAQTLTLGPVAYSYSGPLGTAQVAMSGTVTIGDPDTSTVAGTCQPTACSAAATSGSVIATLEYDVTIDGVPAGAFIVTVDLGTAMAKTSYTAAPVA